MPPTLRSAQNSPASKTSAAPSTNATPTTTPTRKAPHCSKCKRPRAGHPRSGCPNDEDAPITKMRLPSGTPGPGGLTTALGSMVLDATPTKATLTGDGEDVKAALRARRRSAPRTPARNETLLSMSSTSNEILARLAQPGAFDDGEGDEDEKGARIVRWQELVAASPAAATAASRQATAARTKAARSPMPGSLFPPPSRDTSFASSAAAPVLKQESPSARSSRDAGVEDESASDNDDDAASLATTVQLGRARPLARTMSAVERDVFVSKLSGEAPATIYTVPKADVDAIMDQALALGFIAELVTNDDADDPNALIILGREAGAVQTLLRKVERENSAARNSGAKPPSRLRTVAGAAVVGAIGTWAGLAFT